MKKILSVLLIMAFASINFSSAVLANDTGFMVPVLVQADYGVDTASFKTGDAVKFKVVNAVTNASGETVIATGTPVIATVKNAKKASRVGIPGTITLGDFNTTSINGANIPLAGEINEKAKSKVALSVAVSAVVIPFFLLMKGQQAQINTGEQFTLYTTQNVLK